MRRLLTIIVLLLALILGIGLFAAFTRKNSAASAEETPAAASPLPAETPEPSAEPSPDPSAFTDTESLLVVANKKHRLPEGYIPPDLVTPNIRQTQACQMRREAAEWIAKMAEAAAEDGVNLSISSAYRGEDYQRSLYENYKAQYGMETADTISSRPGYSDHQTGLAADFVEGDGSFDGINFNQSFETTGSGEWLRNHAHEYGFIMRYPKDKQDITGYAYEPWHYRYVGTDAATKIWTAGEFESFEEYYGVDGGDYAE